jgi:hypothetical protein
MVRGHVISPVGTCLSECDDKSSPTREERAVGLLFKEQGRHVSIKLVKPIANFYLKSYS